MTPRDGDDDDARPRLPSHGVIPKTRVFSSGWAAHLRLPFPFAPTIRLRFGAKGRPRQSPTAEKPRVAGNFHLFPSVLSLRDGVMPPLGHYKPHNRSLP